MQNSREELLEIITTTIREKERRKQIDIDFFLDYFACDWKRRAEKRQRPDDRTREQRREKKTKTETKRVNKEKDHSVSCLESTGPPSPVTLPLTGLQVRLKPTFMTQSS